MTAPQLQPLYSVEAIMQRYKVSKRVAQRIANEAGRILVGGRFMVPEDRLFAWEQRNTFVEPDADDQVTAAGISGTGLGISMYDPDSTLPDDLPAHWWEDDE